MMISFNADNKNIHIFPFLPLPSLPWESVSRYLTRIAEQKKISNKKMERDPAIYFLINATS